MPDVTDSFYGRRIDEIMRWRKDNLPDCGADEGGSAQASRSTPEWAVFRTLTSVGPKATLITGDAGGWCVG
jgi:hypothetical protein